MLSLGLSLVASGLGGLAGTSPGCSRAGTTGQARGVPRMGTCGYRSPRVPGEWGVPLLSCIPLQAQPQGWVLGCTAWDKGCGHPHGSPKQLIELFLAWNSLAQLDSAQLRSAARREVS